MINEELDCKVCLSLVEVWENNISQRVEVSVTECIQDRVKKNNHGSDLLARQAEHRYDAAEVVDRDLIAAVDADVDLEICLDVKRLLRRSCGRGRYLNRYRRRYNRRHLLRCTWWLRRQ